MKYFNRLKCLEKTAFLVALIFLLTLQSECNFSLGKDQLKSNSTEVEMIQKFRNRLNQGNLEDLNFTYRISGGMPAEGRIDMEIQISANDNSVTARSVEGNTLPLEASKNIETTELQTLLQKVEQNIESLIPRSEAQFLPDSVVGSICIEIDGKQEKFYFLVDERQLIEAPLERNLTSLGEGNLTSSGIAEMIDAFSQLSNQILERN